MNEPCIGPDDTSFGPVIAVCRRTFDFTVLFEQVILSLLPSVVFILLALAQIASSWNAPAVAKRGHHYKWKLILVASVSANSLVFLVQQSIVGNNLTHAAIASTTVALVAVLMLGFISDRHHRYSLRPSSLIIIFLALSCLFDAVRVRTEALREQNGGAIILGVGALLKLGLLLVESRGKKKDLIAPRDEKSSEELAGPISRTLFHWVNPLLLNGYRNLLTISGIGSIDSTFASVDVAKRFALINDEGIQKDFKAHGLIYLTFQALGRHLLGPVIPRLCLSAFTFSQQFLVNAILKVLSDPNPKQANASYGLIGASFFIYFGIAASNSWYWHQVNRSAVMIRGGLVITLFDKLFRLPEDHSIESRAMTLMFSDTQRVMTSMNYIHETWASSIETAISTWLLYRQIRSASFAMLGLALSISAASIILSRKISGKQQTWLAAVDTRLGLTKRMLASLKAMKMLAADSRLSYGVTLLRQAELATAWPFRRLRTITTILSYGTITLSPPLVFGVYIAMSSANQDLDVATLFTSLTVINLFATSLMHVVQAIPSFGSAHGCMQRIEDFLRLPERKDPRSTTPEDVETEASEKDSVSSHHKELLSLRQVSLGWEADKPVLKNIDLDIKRGTRIAILGRIGSGKTLFFKGLLGEVQQISGTVAIERGATFAYCGPTPWLENTSIENNILQYCLENNRQEMLKKVAELCCIGDLLDRSDSSQGSIGSQGVKLSGGQRQRLALARSLTLGRDVILLDDVFSALDRRTRLQIAENLFRPKKDLSDSSPAIVYSTNDPQLASYADLVFEITSSGNLEQVERQSLQVDAVQPVENDEQSESTEQVEDGQLSGDESAPLATRPPKDRLVYMTYLHSMGWINATAFLLLGASFAVALKFPDIWAQWWSNANVRGDHSHATNYWIGVYSGLAFLPLIALGTLSGHLWYNIVPVVGITLHTKLLNSVVHAPFPHISALDTGTIINRFNQDLMLVDSLLPFDLFNTTTELYTAIVQVVLVVTANARALVAIPAVVIVLYMVQRFYLRTSKQLRLLDLESKSVLHGLVSDVAAGSGPSTIRANGFKDHVRAKFLDKLDASQRPVYLLLSVQRWLQLVLNLVVMGLVVLVAGVTSALRSNVNVGAVGVAFVNATTLGETLTWLVVSYTSLETSLGAIARIVSFELETPSEGDVGKASPSADPSQKSNGSIRVENLWTSYWQDDAATEEAAEDDSSWSLRGVSVSIPAGEKVSICGRTGSGKSTLLLALLRMVYIKTGSISVDGIDHASMSLEQLRKSFLVISQDLLQESCSIREHQDPEGHFTDIQIQQVAEECGVWGRIVVGGGLSSGVLDIPFSTGEAQLLQLVRVVLYGKLKQGGIVLLDEVTSGLDEQTKATFDNLLETKLQDKTVISVSHNLPSALRADRILVLDKGQIIHDGSPEYILQHSALFAGLTKEVSGSE